MLSEFIKKYIDKFGFKFKQELNLDFEYIDKQGNTLYYNFKTNTLYVYDIYNNVIISNAKIRSILDFQVIMTCLQFEITN